MSDSKTATTTTPATKTYSGSCHCGAVRFEADLDLTKPVSRCNCSICTKLSACGANMKPGDFRLVQGRESLSTYRVGGDSVNAREFCKVCGTQVYGHGNVPEIGGEFVSINVSCLDGVELSELEVVYWDGRHDNWMAGARDRPWPIYLPEERAAGAASSARA